LAAIYEGASRTEAARIGGVTLQIVRDWVVKFNAAGPDGLIDRKAPGKAPLLNATHRAALVEAIERGPIPAVHGVVRWRIVDLAQMLWDDFSLSVLAERALASSLHQTALLISALLIEVFSLPSAWDKVEAGTVTKWPFKIICTSPFCVTRLTEATRWPVLS
jgi:transposase